MHPWAYTEIFPRGRNVQILLNPFQVADDKCKWTFTNSKRFTHSTPLVCDGCISIVSLLYEIFSTLRLSEMLFLFMNCLISILKLDFFNNFLQTSHKLQLRIINGQNSMSSEKTS